MYCCTLIGKNCDAKTLKQHGNNTIVTLMSVVSKYNTPIIHRLHTCDTTQIGHQHSNLLVP